MEKILSVSVAAYNVEKYIRQTMDCFIVPEIMDKIEILIVNDGSTDDTVNVVKEYTDKYPDTFILVNKTNGGWGSTVNTGIEYASGKYFKQLDGDDYFDSNNLIDFLNYLEEHDEDLIYTGFVSFDDETGDEISVTSVKKEYENKTINIEDAVIDFPLAMHSCTFKTKILKVLPINITENCFYTDIEYMLKAMVRVKDIFFLPINVYCYRLGRTGQSASIEGARKHYKEHIKVTLKLLKFYSELDINNNVKEIVKDRLTLMVDYQYNIFLNLKPTGIHARELKNFDNEVKNKYNEFYETGRKRIKIFRKFGRLTYPLMVYRGK